MFGEFQGAGQGVKPYRAQQQQSTTRQGIDQIGLPGLACHLSATMHHQWIGSQGQQFVEHQKGEQIAGQCHAGCRSYAQTEKPKEAAAMGRAFQVTDGIHRGQQPQDCRQSDKQQGQRIGPQHQFDIRQQRQPRFKVMPLRDTPQHPSHKKQLGNGTTYVEYSTQAYPVLRQHKDDQPRQQGAQHHQQR